MRLRESVWWAMQAHALAGLPEEACGLFAAASPPAAAPIVERFYPCRNAAASAKLYTVEPADHLRADRDAEGSGMELIGVMHSHTHTDPYPSPTDVAQAMDPNWHYIIVSLRLAEPMLRSYRIVDGHITEEPVEVLVDPPD